MIKIIERADGKFVWKEVDEAGNSVQTGEIAYDSYAECEKALGGEEVVKEEAATVADAPVADAVEGKSGTATVEYEDTISPIAPVSEDESSAD